MTSEKYHMATHYIETVQVKDGYVKLIDKDGDIVAGLPVHVVELMYKAVKAAQ